MVEAQKYLAKIYPNQEDQKVVKFLNFSNLNEENTLFSSEKRLEGHLDLSIFFELTKLLCHCNLLTSLNIKKCSNIL